MAADLRSMSRDAKYFFHHDQLSVKAFGVYKLIGAKSDTKYVGSYSHPGHGFFFFSTDVVIKQVGEYDVVSMWDVENNTWLDVNKHDPIKVETVECIDMSDITVLLEQAFVEDFPDVVDANIRVLAVVQISHREYEFLYETPEGLTSFLEMDDSFEYGTYPYVYSNGYITYDWHRDELVNQCYFYVGDETFSKEVALMMNRSAYEEVLQIFLDDAKTPEFREEIKERFNEFIKTLPDEFSHDIRERAGDLISILN